MVEPGYKQGQSDNLPYIDEFMVANYIKNNDCFTAVEIRGAKSASASREDYGDSAIGYVQVKRDGEKCFVKAKITPEHNVRKKMYSVSMEINENLNNIDNIKCFDCAASEGGCKHATAFLMWMHRRSRDPSPTEVACYWKKPMLSRVGTSLKFIMAKDFNSPLPKDLPATSSKSSDPPSTSACSTKSDETFNTFWEQCKRNKMTSGTLFFHEVNNLPSSILTSSMHQAMIDFIGTDPDQFVLFIKSKITNAVVSEVADHTIEQNKSATWYEMRYGRITASKAHEAAHCKTPEGSLVETIMGANKIIDSAPMKRGRNLEKVVIQELELIFKRRILPSGFYISKEHPFIGGSPDGETTDYIIEVKCPSSKSTIKNYYDDNNKLTQKCYAQVQIQMYVTNKKICKFCVADPEFEQNKIINIIDVERDEMYINNILKCMYIFWSKYVFPIIYKTVNI